MGSAGYEEEGLIIGHAKPMSKNEMIELFNNEESMCLIFSQKIIEGRQEVIKGTGFFLEINNKDIPFRKCLITNNHILTKNYIETYNKIKIEYKKETKFISLNKTRNVFTDEKLDYTIIEILDEDNINKFFEIDKNINNIHLYNGKDIFILQYLNSNELLFSNGIIISIEDNIIKHTCSTSNGASGSPIILRYSNSNIIGLHCGANKKKIII